MILIANEWNVSYPLDHTKIGDVPGEIRKLKDSTKDQIDREHETPVDGDATGGEHSNGSAVAYVGAATPTNRPDGATALADNDVDDGRLWLDDTVTPAILKRWKDSAFALVQTTPFGAWTSKSNNTSYLAATDGIVCAIATVNTSVSIKSDAASPPTTVRSYCSALGAAKQGSAISPVKKGHYYLAEGADTVVWMPIGS